MVELTPAMKSWRRKCQDYGQGMTVAIVLHVLHAALVELSRSDTRVNEELAQLPKGMCYAIAASPQGPYLRLVLTKQGLQRTLWQAEGDCVLRIKSLPHAFLLFSGQMGLAQAFAEHAFSMQGEIASVMKLVRLVHVAESHLFPHWMCRSLMVQTPPRQMNPLVLYARIMWGFITHKYPLTTP